jgi:hypothetical protein
MSTSAPLCSARYRPAWIIAAVFVRRATNEPGRVLMDASRRRFGYGVTVRPFTIASLSLMQSVTSFA